MKPIPPRVKAVLRMGIGLLMIVFLVVVLAKNWNGLREHGVRVVWTWFALAVLANFVFFITQALVWRESLAGLGFGIAHFPAISVWSNSQVAKYVPGKVMLLLVRVDQAGRLGATRTATLTAIYLELMLMMAVTAIASLLLAPAVLTKFWNFHPHPLYVALPILAVVVGLHPKLLNGIVNRALRIMKKDPITFDISYWKIMLLAALLTGGLLMHGLSAVASFAAIGASPNASWITLTGFFAFAWLAGFLSFLTPGGIGVREGVLAAALSINAPMEIAVAVSLVSRLAWMAAEVIMAAVFWRFRPRIKVSWTS